MVSAVIATGSVSVGFADTLFVPDEQVAAGAQVGAFSRPAVLNTRVADVLVRVRGGANCSGTPILGGTLVVTAAHCVIDDNGQVAASRTVVRDGESYKPAAVLVNRQYHDLRHVRLDAAVLVMSEAIPARQRISGSGFPTPDWRQSRACSRSTPIGRCCEALGTTTGRTSGRRAAPSSRSRRARRGASAR